MTMGGWLLLTLLLGALLGFLLGSALTLWRIPRILSVMSPDQFRALMERVDEEDKRGVDR